MPLDAAQPTEVRRTRTAAYLKAAIFLAPPLLIWTAITLYVTPIIKRICADTDAPPFAAFAVIDFAHDNALILILAAVAIVILLEWKAARSSHLLRWRKYAVGTAVFLINTAVLIGLGSLLLIAAIAAPGLLDL